MNEPPVPDDVREQLLAALRGEAPAIICATRCEPCMYGQHYQPPAPHPWAGPEDIAHAAATGQPEPTGNCGCHCARSTT
jgi:hypothetical protein